MAVLIFGAVDLDYGAWIIQQRLSRSLNYASLAGARWAEKQKIPDRAPARG
jgi:hypothetical protein